MIPTRIIGDCQLYLGDCRDILPTLPKVDAVITDPPYGIGEAAGKNKSRGKLAVAKDYGNDDWDNAPPDKDLLDAIVGAGDTAILWGGNYFIVNPSSCWLVWDKENGASDFADCELAWTNMPKAVRRIKWRWAGMLQENMAQKEERVHPTQKPLAVMKWCIEQAGNPQTILDPFMGSGTTGVAAVQMGRKFIGIERETKYFDIACKRIEQAYAQPDFFVKPEVNVAKQESLI